MDKIIVFTLPNCVPCKALKEDLKKEEKWFKDKKIEVELRDMSDETEETLMLATQYTIRSAPTIVWLGLILDEMGCLGIFRNIEEFKTEYEHREEDE